MIDDQLRAQRLFLTDHLRKQTDFPQTDQSRGLPPPPVQKPVPPAARRVSLPDSTNGRNPSGKRPWSRPLPGGRADAGSPRRNWP